MLSVRRPLCVGVLVFAAGLIGVAPAVGQGTAGANDGSAPKPKADSTAQAAGLDRQVSAGSAQPIVLVDTTLASACAGSRPGSVADGLLIVMFDPTATTATRSAAVKRVGGALVARDGAGDFYVRLSGDANSQPTSVVADRLIQMPEIRSVEAVPCPAAPSLPQAVEAQADTGRSP